MERKWKWKDMRDGKQREMGGTGDMERKRKWEEQGNENRLKFYFIENDFHRNCSAIQCTCASFFQVGGE